MMLIRTRTLMAMVCHSLFENPLQMLCNCMVNIFLQDPNPRSKFHDELCPFGILRQGRIHAQCLRGVVCIGRCIGSCTCICIRVVVVVVVVECKSDLIGAGLQLLCEYKRRMCSSLQ